VYDIGGVKLVEPCHRDDPCRYQSRDAAEPATLSQQQSAPVSAFTCDNSK